MGETFHSSSPSLARNDWAIDDSIFNQAPEVCDIIAEAMQLVVAEHCDLVAGSTGQLQSDCPLTSELKKIGSANARLRKRLNDPTCRVGLIGEFSAGKSTFVNALLGQDVLEAGVIQGTTTFPIRIRYADRLGVELHLRDGSRVPLSDKNRFGLLEQLRACAQDHDVENRISHASLYVPSSLLESNIEIIDAPGIDSISKSHLRLTLEAINRFCDSFVILLPSTMPATLNLLSFVRDNLQAKYHRCVFLITKTDLLRSAHDVEAVIGNAKARIMSELTLTSEPLVYGCAAEIELCRAIGVDSNEGRSRRLTDEKIAAFCSEFQNVRNQIIDFARLQQRSVVRDHLNQQVRQLRGCLKACLEEPFRQIGFVDELYMWADCSQVEARSHQILQEIKSILSSRLDSAVVRFQNEAGREFNQIGSSMASDLNLKTDLKSAALWARNSPRSNMQEVCSKLESRCREDWTAYLNECNKLFQESIAQLENEFSHFRFPSKTRIQSSLSIALRSIAEQQTKMFVNIATEDSSGWAGMGGATAGAAAGSLLLGPVGLFVGGWLGAVVGEALGNGTEALKEDVRGKLADCVRSAQREAVSKVKREWENDFESQIKKIEGEIKRAVSSYRTEREKFERARPDTGSIRVRCSEAAKQLSHFSF